MGLLLLLNDPDLLARPARVKLDTFLTSVTFPECDVAASRANTMILAADNTTSIVASDPSTSIVAA
jgi:hypothetical protein